MFLILDTMNRRHDLTCNMRHVVVKDLLMTKVLSRISEIAHPPAVQFKVPISLHDQRIPWAYIHILWSHVCIAYTQYMQWKQYRFKHQQTTIK